MAEVYTISGSGFGAAVARSAPLRLQNALKALGNLRGDPALSKIGVDGIIGAKTVKAVNYAIAQKYVVMPSFPRPELTLQHVRQFSAGIATAVEGAVKAGGGSFPLISASIPTHARGGGGGAGGGGAMTALPEIPTPEADRRWIWWAVGGLGVIVVLSIAAKAVGGKKASRRRSRDDDDED